MLHLLIPHQAQLTNGICCGAVNLKLKKVDALDNGHDHMVKDFHAHAFQVVMCTGSDPGSEDMQDFMHNTTSTCIPLEANMMTTQSQCCIIKCIAVLAWQIIVHAVKVLTCRAHS